MSTFPSRKEISSKPKNEIKEDGFNRDKQVSIIEKQKSYVWIRVYLRDEKI